jgi:hypothetical protein
MAMKKPILGRAGFRNNVVMTGYFQFLDELEEAMPPGDFVAHFDAVYPDEKGDGKRIVAVWQRTRQLAVSAEDRAQLVKQGESDLRRRR